MMITRQKAEISTAIATAIVGATVCYGATEIGISWGPDGPQPGYFPFYVGALIILGSAITLLQAVRKGRAEVFLESHSASAVIGFFLPVVALTLITVFLGLYIAIVAYVFYALWRGAKVRRIRAIAAGIFVAAVNFVIFEVLFTVPLLKGPVLNALGIY